MTTYRSSNVLVQLGRAQAELYEHLHADNAGRCPTCRKPETCRKRQELTADILDYGVLPQRRPGIAGGQVFGFGGDHNNSRQHSSPSRS